MQFSLHVRRNEQIIKRKGQAIMMWKIMDKEI